MTREKEDSTLNSTELVKISEDGSMDKLIKHSNGNQNIDFRFTLSKSKVD